MSRMGSAFLPLVTDCTHPEPFLLMQQFGRPGCFLLVWDYGAIDSPLSAHALACLDSLLSLLTTSRLELQLSLLDHNLIDSSLFLRSLVCLDSSVFALEMTNLGSLTSTQGFAQLESALLALGICRVGPVSSSFVMGTVQPGSVLPLQGRASYDFALFVLDLLHLDFLMPLRSPS